MPPPPPAFNDPDSYESFYDSPWGGYADRAQRALFLRMARPTAGETFLDVGCGTGRYLQWLDELGLRATGIDIAPEMVSARGARWARSSDTPTPIVADAHHLPFHDSAFDLVSTITSLEFMQQPEAVIAQMGRVCAGRLFIGAIGRHSFYARQLRQRGDASLTSQGQLYTPAELLELVQAALPEWRCEWRTTLLGPKIDNPAAIDWLRALDRLPATQRLPWGAYIGLLARRS